MSNLVRPLVSALDPYVPGEQPRIPGLIKLNTNENPYPPSPRVLESVRKAVDGRLRLYPDPTCGKLREALARMHGCEADQILVGNGSDELLAMAVRAFVEPARPGGRGGAETMVQSFTPSYSLYPALAAIHGAVFRPVPLEPDFSFPAPGGRKGPKGWNGAAALTFVTTPNAPTGCGYSRVELDRLCRRHSGVVVLDEAYVDFAEEDAMELALKHPHVLVMRTFSKAYSLCAQRIGYVVGHSRLIDALNRLRDSYNVNGLGQVAALATLKNLGYYRRNFGRVKKTRSFLTRELVGLGFEVFPSQTNFILVRPPGPPAERWLLELRKRKILVRWFRSSAISGFLRISIGTDLEARRLVEASRGILDQG